jgi:hypothetical protein
MSGSLKDAAQIDRPIGEFKLRGLSRRDHVSLVIRRINTPGGARIRCVLILSEHRQNSRSRFYNLTTN